MDQIVSSVYVTKDYSKFKRLDGNRDVTKARAKKIKKSIVENGYIHNPIIVNDKFEVIDGQGRLEALIDLNMPVEYIMFEGMTVEHCVALNIFQTAWNLLDYIESFADRGNRSYEFLLALIRKYECLGINTCVCACTGLVSSNNNPRVKCGEFTCSPEQYEKADELLGYVMQFFKTTQSFKKGPSNYLYHAIMFAYQVEGVDTDKLTERFNRYFGMSDVPNFIDTRSAMQVLTNVYNRRSRDKVYFEIEYERYLSKKYTWYAKKHGRGIA